MSAIIKLQQTYDALAAHEDIKDLMPIFHSKQNAHIEISLNASGEFLDVRVLDKTQIVLPSTEDSESRTSGEAPHGLADKLHYLAGDYQNYGGKKNCYFNGFITQLEEWVSYNNHPKVAAVLAYLKKKSILSDLIARGICYVDDKNQLIDKWQQENIPELFKSLPRTGGVTQQENALVCWRVEIPQDEIPETWQDKSIHKSWIDYIASQDSVEDLCLITGEIKTIAKKHPAGIRSSGDRAKLISSNDGSGFTYRGRFLKPQQVATVSFDATQKAHNALRWLIQNRATRNGDQYIITWALNGTVIPEPEGEVELTFDDFLFDATNKEESTEKIIENEINHCSDMGMRFSCLFNRKISGYSSSVPISPNDSILVMTIDSATPGRMAVLYYHEFQPIHYFSNLEAWHLDFAWYQRLEKDRQKKANSKWHICAPSNWTIYDAVYGDVSDSNKALKKALNSRLMMCIVEKKPLPFDIMHRAFRRAISRHVYAFKEQWRFERNLGVACGLYRGYMARTESRKLKMALDEKAASRDYLFGRLLAIADNIEQFKLSISKNERLTAAGRLMQSFADRPFSTWKNIELALQPYIRKLNHSHRGFMEARRVKINEVMGLFQRDDFTNNKPLNAEFLLGFHCQALELTRSKDKVGKQEISV